MVLWTDRPLAKPAATVLEASGAKTHGSNETIVSHRQKAEKSGTTKSLHVVAVCLAFAVILASYLVFSRSPGAHNVTTREPMPANEMSAGRVVVFSDAAKCREYGFNNNSGKMVEVATPTCDSGQPDNTTEQSFYRHSANRLEAIRRSFAPR